MRLTWLSSLLLELEKGVVCRQGQELFERRLRDEAREQRTRFTEAPARVAIGADRRSYELDLFVEDTSEELRRNRAAILEPRAVMNPLPELRPRDLRGGRVLHQVIERDA